MSVLEVLSDQQHRSLIAYHLTVDLLTAINNRMHNSWRIQSNLGRRLEILFSDEVVPCKESGEVLLREDMLGLAPIEYEIFVALFPIRIWLDTPLCKRAIAVIVSDSN